MSNGVTLLRMQPIDKEKKTATSALMNKPVFSFPLRKPMDSSSPEIQEIKQKERNYQKKLKEHECLQEIADFEKKISGKTQPPPPPLDLLPPTKEQLELLQSISPPSPTQFWNIYTPIQAPASSPETIRAERIRSMLSDLPFSQKGSPRQKPPKQVRTSGEGSKPAVWTLLDEPTVPSSDFSAHKPLREPSKPFYRLAHYDNTRGIPIVSDRMRKDNDRKYNAYLVKVRTECACDNERQETTLKERVNHSLACSRKKREQTAILMNITGQDWVSREIAKKHRRQKVEEERVVLTAEDKDSLAFLDRIDEQIRQDKKLRMRLDEKEDGQLTRRGSIVK